MNYVLNPNIVHIPTVYVGQCNWIMQAIMWIVQRFIYYVCHLCVNIILRSCPIGCITRVAFRFVRLFSVCLQFYNKGWKVNKVLCMFPIAGLIDIEGQMANIASSYFNNS